MAAEREIKTVLTLDDASFSKGLKAATSSVSAARAEMQASVASAGGLTKSLKKYSAQVTGLNKVLKAEKQQMTVLKKEYDLQKKKLKEAADALKTAKKLHAENSDEVKKAANAYASASSSVDELRVKMAKLNTQVAQDKNALSSLVTGPLAKIGGALGKGATGFATMAVAAIAAAGAALVKFTQDSDAAQNTLKQNLAASETEFGVWSKFIEQEADKAWQNLGLSKSAYLAAATDIGEFLQEAGAPVEKSAEISAQVLEMAAGLSKEYGVPIEEVLSDIKDAANGSRTAMQRYGIQVTGTTVQQTSLTYAMTEEEKKLWAVKQILDQSKQAQKDYTTETNNITEASNTLTAAWENFLSGAGSAEDVGKAAGNLVSAWADKIVDEGPQMVQSAISMAGTFLDAFLESFSSTWTEKIWPEIQEFFKAKLGVELPNWETTVQNMQSWWDTYIQPSYDFVADYFVAAGQTIREAAELVTGWWDDVTAWVDNNETLQAVFSVIGEARDKAVAIVSDWWSTISESVRKQGILKTVFHLAGDTWENLKPVVTEWWDGVKAKVANIVTTVFGINFPSLGEIKQKISDWWGIMKEKVAGLVSSVFSIQFPSWDEIAESWNTFWSNAYNNLPGWLKDILNFFGLGGGSAPAGETALNKAVNDLADMVGSASNSINALGKATSDAALAAAGAAERFSVTFTGGESGSHFTGVGGKFAGGSWNIPLDNYIAALHKGEMVLTADQARRYRAAAASGGNTYNDSASIYIDKYNQYSGADADALLQQMQMMQRRQRMGYGLA